MKQTIFLLAVVVLAASAGCKRDENPPRVDPGHAYFPVDTGRWIDYKVDSIWRNDITGVTDSTSYLLREKITNDFLDAQGRTAQRLVRYMAADNGSWTPKDVWWQVRTPANAERAEENQRRVKLIFPPRTGEYWNTNATNVGRPYELTYLAVDVPWSVNGMSFDSTLLVKTTYQNNAIITNTYYERYAKNVGLVYRQVDSTNTQYLDGIPKVRGTWYKQTITGYGH